MALPRGAMSCLRFVIVVFPIFVFWIDDVCFRFKLFDGQMTRQDVLDLNWHNVEVDTCIVLHVKHACELIFQPCIVVKCIYTDVLTILLFHTNNKEGVVRSKAAVLCC